MNCLNIPSLAKLFFFYLAMAPYTEKVQEVVYFIEKITEDKVR